MNAPQAIDAQAPRPPFQGPGRAWLTLGILGLLLVGGALAADDQPQRGAEGGIRFLRLKADRRGFTLLQDELRPGVLKQPRDGRSRGEIDCELLDGENRVLWQGRVEDPLVRRFEAADPEQPGRWIAKELRLTEAEFTVRVPHRAGAVVLQLRHRPAAAPIGAAPDSERKPVRLALPPVPSARGSAP